MTKDKINKFLKRYPFIKKAVANNQQYAVFYIGKRKHNIKISKEILILLEILDDIEENSPQEHELFILNGLKNGKSDISLIQEIPYERTSYYAIKQELINRIYACSICKGLVDYEEILKSGRK